jgi:hypothetical protein
MMQYSVHPPSQFIYQNCEQLLPNWSSPIQSVVVVLQPSRLELNQQTPEVESQKHYLRSLFLNFGFKVTQQLQKMGYLAELFDPRTGLPVLSQAGALRLDDVAVVRSSLGYATAQIGDCFTILHPDWGSAVYPSIVMSSADRTVVESVVNKVAGLLEYHHSFKG